MTDIHCHILPGVDDGSTTMEQSLAMVRMESEGGTRKFIATPHMIEAKDLQAVDGYADLLGELNAAIAAEGIPVTVSQGAEVYPSLRMLDALDAGKPITLAQTGKYMLVDLPMGQYPHDLDAFLFGLQARGVTPIMAHPERTQPMQVDPERLQSYMDRGVLIQVNAGSLSGRYGAQAVETAIYFLEKGWANIIASDAHRPGRKPSLGNCVSLWSAKFGPEYMHYLTAIAPGAVLRGEAVPPVPAISKREKAPGVFGRMRERFRGRSFSMT